jgi:hypothetical protein
MVCCNWEMERKKEMLKYQPPKDYPEDMLPEDGMLTPRKLSYE